MRGQKSITILMKSGITTIHNNAAIVPKMIVGMYDFFMVVVKIAS